MSKGKILIVEDDRDIAGMIEYNLREERYETISAFNGKDGVEQAKKEKPDLIILDIMLPIIDGFEVCRIIKKENITADIPVIILSAKSQETDKVVGLELGADDYITKPFSPRELIARIRVILRRGRTLHLDGSIERGDIVIDSNKHRVMVGQKDITLTFTEFKLLEFLAKRPGMVFSRDQILDGVIGDDALVCDRTVDAHIKSLRRKLEQAKDYIETVRGAGYRFKEL